MKRIILLSTIIASTLIAALTLIGNNPVQAVGPVPKINQEVFGKGAHFFDPIEAERAPYGTRKGGGGSGVWSWPTDRHMIGNGNPNDTIINGNSCVDGRTPQSGYGCAGYGYRIYSGVNPHQGIDIWSGCGTAVHPVDSGTVIFAQYSGSYGNLIIIDHGGGIQSAYAHLQNFIITSGPVTTADVIALSGDTGGVPCHLHLELRENGFGNDDPGKYLPSS